ncbi:unnamed protein product [Caenorhabditis bovis]|uniref:BTB domain-containing protein n=1 Tax=Caenorhabditis bovis TaxID=2654633 RepID=A0A8S1EN19_9PELO|nr:unnamed protein product [Caenorhabditis bovis]
MYSYEYLPENHTKGQIIYKFKDVRSVSDQVFLSTRVNRMLWTLTLEFNKTMNMRNRKEGRRYIEAKIKCHNNIKTNFECVAKVALKTVLRAENGKITTIVSVSNPVYSPDHAECRMIQFEDNLFYADVEMQLEIIVISCKGIPEIYDPLKSIPEFADVTLIIEGKKLKSNKLYLTMHSPVFGKMFSDNPQNEYVLDNVSFSQFVLLHNAIMPAGEDIKGIN